MLILLNFLLYINEKISSKNSTYRRNCIETFEKLYNELHTFKNMVSIEFDSIKNMVFTVHSMCSDYFNQHNKKDDLKDKFDIPFTTPNTIQTNDTSKKISKQPCNSPFMHVSSQNIGRPSAENSNKKLDLNYKNNEKSPTI